MTLGERKLLAHIQLRHGPRRTGWHGLLQPIADGIKLVTKEVIIPVEADPKLFIIAPVISVAFALIPFAVVPFARHTFITDINIGLLYILAASSVGFIGTIMGGWASGSKYSFLGGLRALALMISYELPLVLSLVGVLMFTRSLSMVDIVKAQGREGWFVFSQPLAFVIYVISGIAETQRTPFDMLEDEGSLVTGFFTEYSGMPFAIFFMAEYVNMFMVSILATTLFLGGWQRPAVTWAALGFLDKVPTVFWFCLKVFGFMFLYVWLRGTLPRVRYDQLMYLCWKILFPLALLNLFFTALYIMFNMNIWLFYALNLVATACWFVVYAKIRFKAKASAALCPSATS